MSAEPFSSSTAEYSFLPIMMPLEPPTGLTETFTLSALPPLFLMVRQSFPDSSASRILSLLESMNFMSIRSSGGINIEEAVTSFTLNEIL